MENNTNKLLLTSKYWMKSFCADRLVDEVLSNGIVISRPNIIRMSKSKNIYRLINTLSHFSTYYVHKWFFIKLSSFWMSPLSTFFRRQIAPEGTITLNNRREVSFGHFVTTSFLKEILIYFVTFKTLFLFSKFSHFMLK